MQLSEFKNKILNRKGALDKPTVLYSSLQANQIMCNAILSGRPLMIARLGAFELGMTLSVQTPITLKNICRLLRGEIATIGYNRKLAHYLCYNAGFFPNNKRNIERFAHLVMEDMHFVDILGSWLPAEKYFAKELSHATKVKLFDLEPFHHKNPYTLLLRGKKVLVIHPYKDTIIHQWANRRLIWGENEIMPECELTVIKAVQSIAGNETDFCTWFDALDYMKQQIDKVDFDIALIGCGAYGFHLAAYIKRLGKQAIHLGGLSQLLFGILGKRWDHKYDFINQYWIRPLDSDTPKNKNTIENGCYW